MKKVLVSSIVTFAVMFLLPFAVAKLSPEDAGMALCFILFYLVNPVLSIGVGVLSGFEIKKAWYMPIVVALTFLLSSWIIFDFGELDFVLYSIIYLILSAVSMLITFLIINLIKKKGLSTR